MYEKRYRWRNLDMHNSKFLVKKSPLQNRIWKYQDAFKKSISIIDCRIFVCFIWDGSKLLNWYDVIIFVKSIHHHQIFWVVLGRKIAREFFCMPQKFVFQENCRKYNKKWQFFWKTCNQVTWRQLAFSKYFITRRINFLQFSLGTYFSTQKRVPKFFAFFVVRGPGYWKTFKIVKNR